MKNKWNETDKLGKFLIVGILIIIVAICITGLVQKDIEKKHTPPDDADSNLEKIEKETENIEVTYRDKDADLNYNYIINPGELDMDEMPADGVLTLIDAISDEFKNNGIYGSQIKLENVNRKGSKITFVAVDGLSGTKVNVTYDYTSNTYDFYTQVQ